MRTCCVYDVDVFATDEYRGNSAGVVLEADELSDEQMRMIARLANHSETAFVLRPDGDDHDVRVRFFTPTTEVPACGHATIAAQYVRALTLKMPTGTIVQKTRAGCFRIDVERGSRDYRITLVQEPILFGTVLGTGQQLEILGALGISIAERDRRCPMQIVSTGHSKVMIGLRDRATLNGARPDLVRLARISGEIRCNGYFVFTLDFNDERVLAHGRMFAPAIGIPEDPVTGNANGPLGAYLVRHGLLAANNSEVSFRSKQGEAMGRPGIVEVTVELTRETPSRVRISGRARVARRVILKRRDCAALESVRQC